MFRALSYCVLFLTLAGCATTSSRTPEIFETMLAPASKSHPRQSEGDVVALTDGRLLAGWTDFTGGGADHATASIAGATSRDGGRSWSAPFELQRNIGKQNVMSVSFLRVRSGELLFFFLVKNSDSDLQVMVRRGKEEKAVEDYRSPRRFATNCAGVNFGEPEVVTAGAGYHIMNNGRAVQLRSGRILCPVSFYDAGGWHGAHLRCVMFFSDDDGHSWQKGKSVIDCPKRGAMEPGVVELKDGKVLQVIRTGLGEIWFSVSADGGDSWSEPGAFGVVSPEAPCTIGRLPKSGELVLIYNPNIEHGISGMKSRTPLVVSISKDEGKSWSKPKLIETDLNFTYAYTSLTFVGDRALLSYYVSAGGISQSSLKFKSVPVGWFRE